MLLSQVLLSGFTIFPSTLISPWSGIVTKIRSIRVDFPEPADQ